MCPCDSSQMTDVDLTSSPPSLINAKTNESWADQTLEQFGGTRHRSAVRLTQVLPGAIAFVISQDGDLRVFYSDGTGVYSFTDLDAWVTDVDAT